MGSMDFVFCGIASQQDLILVVGFLLDGAQVVVGVDGVTVESGVGHQIDGAPLCSKAKGG